MSVIVNPGTHIAPEGVGWTNTYEGAVAEAKQWLQEMRTEGFGADIDLLEPEEPEERDGRWTFTFEHRVTGVTAELETHGIDDLEAYGRQAFPPRTYWRGSSSATPALADFTAPGFVQTFRPEP